MDKGEDRYLLDFFLFKTTFRTNHKQKTDIKLICFIWFYPHPFNEKTIWSLLNPRSFLSLACIFMKNVNVSHKELMLRQMIDLICRILFYLHSFPLPESLLNLCSFLRAFHGKRLHNLFDLLYFVLSTFISMRRSRKPCWILVSSCQ